MAPLTNLLEIKRNKKLLLILGIMLLFFLAAAPSVYFYQKYQRTQILLSKMSSPPQEETKTLIMEVGKLMLLPEGENPTVATVTDRERLSNQPFFQNAENGDKLLIFNKAKKAIMYRPSLKKIIEVGPINISSPSANIQSTPTAPLVSLTPIPIGKFKLVLLNGTTTVGLTRKYETEIKENLPDTEIVDRDNAAKKDYETSLLVDLKGNQGDQAQKLAQTLNMTLSKLPQGETATSEADFLIILGSDRR